MSAYYDEKYYSWQTKIGKFGGKVEKFKFEKHINEQFTLLDFGCGGGHLLLNLKCQRKIGVEINDTARGYAKKNGLEVFKYSREVPNASCDLIISNHVLEHTLNPYEELKTLFTKLKDGGKIIFVVPNEKKKKYNRTDINKHLYTWCELNLGNLFSAAGFKVLNVKEIYHRWPPYYLSAYKLFGNNLFHVICRIYGFFRRNLSQIQIIAEK